MAPSPCPLDEARRRLRIALRQAAEVDGLLDDGEVLEERKGHVPVALLVTGAMGRRRPVPLAPQRGPAAR